MMRPSFKALLLLLMAGVIMAHASNQASTRVPRPVSGAEVSESSGSSSKHPALISDGAMYELVHMCHHRAWSLMIMNDAGSAAASRGHSSSDSYADGVHRFVLTLTRMGEAEREDGGVDGQGGALPELEAFCRLHGLGIEEREAGGEQGEGGAAVSSWDRRRERQYIITTGEVVDASARDGDGAGHAGALGGAVKDGTSMVQSEAMALVETNRRERRREHAATASHEREGDVNAGSRLLSGDADDDVDDAENVNASRLK